MLTADHLMGVALALIGALQAGPQVQHAPSAQEAPDEELGEIVITARRGAPAVKLDAISYYKRFCFDANRLTGQSAPPFSDTDWDLLDDKTRLQFGISDPNIPAFGLVDTARAHTLLIKFESFRRAGSLIENRCTMVVIGGLSHGSLPDQMSALFRGPGTQRQVGHPDGAEKVKGWRQWLWTGMPGRRSKSWRTINADSRSTPGGTWVVVTDLSFYNDHNYILGDVKTKQGASSALSVLSFAYTTRERNSK